MQTITVQTWANENGIAISETQLQTLAAYQARVLDVNRTMNLTRITDPADFAVKHMIDSMTLLPYIPANAKVADIGTGAGFPGMVLRIMREDIGMTLLDSLRKRVFFLRDTAEMLGLEAECIHARAEDHARERGGYYDVCTARAVASLDKLAFFVLPLVKSGGIFLAMKGAEISAELQNAKPAVQKFGGCIEAVDTVEIAQGLRHSVVVIRKLQHCQALCNTWR